METKKILVATDSSELFEQIKSALLNSGIQLFWAKSGQEVMEVLNGSAQNQTGAPIVLPDLVVCDLQIQNMGGVAICYEMHLETSAGRIPKIPTILLIDREADTFLAEEAGASAHLLKPVNALQLDKIARELLS